jgi:LmbE family N-acetylglucosaminyl deacetylase
MPIHFTDSAQLSAPYVHLFLSPHLDDAALSCGGMIAGLAAVGQPVLVVNLCSGSPAPDLPLSAFAAAMHVRWGLPATEVVRQRLVEDEIALETLGADSYQLDLLDAIYRLPAAYTDDERLFGVVAPTDPLAAQLAPALTELCARYPEAIIYAPLGVGHHVDHQIVCVAALELVRQGMSVAFYEDFPYVATPGALHARLEELGGHELFAPVVTAIDPALSRKIAAIEAYASQIGMLFGDYTAMATAVTAYAASLPATNTTYGERLWIRR